MLGRILSGFLSRIGKKYPFSFNIKAVWKNIKWGRSLKVLGCSIGKIDCVR